MCISGSRTGTSNKTIIDMEVCLERERGVVGVREIDIERDRGNEMKMKVNKNGNTH